MHPIRTSARWPPPPSAQVDLVLSLARFGFDALTVDADAFILRDPLPYIRAYPNADVLTSSDHLAATHGYMVAEGRGHDENLFLYRRADG